mgnify:CR=1 FL=1
MASKDYLLSGFADEIDGDLDKQIRVLKDLGMSYVEFRSAYGKNVSDYSLDEAMEIKNKLDANGIKVSSIGSPIGKIDIEGDLEEHFKLFTHVVDLAKLFESKYIRMFSFYTPQGEDPEDYREKIIKQLKKMIAHAKEQGVILLHENEKGIYGETIDRCKGLMEDLYCDNFKQILDFANFVQADEDPLEAYHELKPYIEYIHVKDARKDNHQVVPPGHGDGHLAEVVALLKKDNYKGFYSLEPHLQHFEGLDKLEREGDKSVVGSDIGDGELAFTLAHKEFVKILEG